MTDFSDTPAWVADAIFYQIFPDRFAMSDRVDRPGPLEAWDSPPTTHGFKGGDVLGIVERLDYLQSLGMNALYLTPVFASASNHRYHTYDYYKVDPLLGGDAALRELLDASHARGFRVVLDGVFNHSGRGFWPFHHVTETGAASPYVEWFYMDRAALASGRELRPYPAPGERGDARRLGYRAWWDLPALPKLNTNNPQMRAYLMGAVEHWTRFGIDGWRLDVPEEIDAGFWREFRQRVRAINPDAYIVGEIWREKPEWVGGDRFDALMNYPLTEALLSFTAADTLDMGVIFRQHEYREAIRPIDGPQFAGRLQHLMTMYRPEAIRAQLNLLGSHDAPRFVTCAGGDRDALRLAMLAVMALPGAPCVYYGDEVGVEGREDPDNRRSFPWDESRWDRALLDPVKCSASLRSSHAALRTGTFRVVAAEGQAVAWERVSPDERAVVVLNASRQETRLTIDADIRDARAVGMPGWGQPTMGHSDGTTTISIAPRTGGLILSHGGAS